jgi:hypothetical protein
MMVEGIYVAVREKRTVYVALLRKCVGKWQVEMNLFVVC